MSHSILSPSSAFRRVRCVGSLAACKDIPNLNSEPAAEGTAYHFIASTVLANRDADITGQADDLGAAGMRCADYVGQKAFVNEAGDVTLGDGLRPADTKFEFVITEENAAHAQTYVDRIWERDGDKHYEVRLDTSKIVGVEGQGGTADCVTLSYKDNTLYVDDLKFGYGIVDALDNEQLLEYGAAALLKYAFHHDWHFLEIAIHQPRARHHAKQIYTVEQVWEWVAKIRPLEQQAFKLWQDPTQLRPEHFTPSSKGCEWCPIRGSCAARNKKVLDQFPIAPPGGKPEAPALQLTNAALLEARNRVDEIEAWCKDIKAEFHQRGVLRGDSFEGWMVAEGKKGNRALDPDKVIEFDGEKVPAKQALDEHVGADAYEPAVLMSASELDKMLNKKRHADAGHRAALWLALQAAISQAPGSKSMVRTDSGKAPAQIARTEFPLQEPT